MSDRIHHLLAHWLEAAPGQPFIHPLDGPALTFRDIGDLTDVLERELRELGVRRDDRVLVVAENCPEHAALIFACSRIGAWFCGVNARMADGEIDAFARKADARLLYFTSAASRNARDHATRWGATASAVPGLSHSAVNAHCTPERVTLRNPDDALAALIFTSGTTGEPKAVMLTHDALLHFARVSAASRRLDHNDRSYAFVPMTHIFGLVTVLMASLAAGAQLVMRSQFDPAQLLDALAREGVSQLQGPPALYSRLLAHMHARGIEHPHAPALRYVYTGAGPLDLSLKQRVEHAFGQTLHHGYGLSEYAGSIHLTRLGEQRADTSAGYVVDEAQVRVTDPATGVERPSGERGELWLRGRGLMPGYFRDDAATRAVMRDGGWYASGDLGEMHPDGALFVVGRLKEMIIRSGFNVYPAEVETALNQFPGVQRAAVIGRPAGDGNEDIVAFVELRPGATLDDAALRAHLKRLLAPYKQPAHIYVLDELPTSGNGKVMKRVLHERLAQLHAQG